MTHLKHTLPAMLLSLLIAGCVASQAPYRASPKPGINDKFNGKVDVEKWVGIFEGESRELFQYRQQITDMLGLKEGMAVADIGAGTGFYSLLFADRVGKTGKVYAVDIAPDFLQHIRQEAQKRGFANVTTLLCTQDSSELPPQSIDVAFICDVYHHFEHPSRTMRSIHRALRPNGELVVIDFIRIEGASSDWVLDHVRAGLEEITREIVAEGFEALRELPDTSFLEESYLVRFRKKG